jgi:hypothetical protein
MARKRKDPPSHVILREQLRAIQEGMEEGKRLMNDKDEYHTLEEVPDPLPDIGVILNKKPGKKGKKLTGSALAIARRNKAKNWVPGQSGNPAGKPVGAKNKNKDPLKQIGLQLAYTNASLTLTPKQKRIAKQLGYAPGDVRLIEALMIHLATSGNPNKIALFMERTFGKVPNINLNAQYSEDLIKRFRSKLTDSELEAIAEGADVLEILFAKLPDADDTESENHFHVPDAIDADIKDVDQDAK